MSTGRCTRLAQMLGLHRLDSDYPNYKTMISPPVDWIEKEERRRAFWGAFYGDRYYIVVLLCIFRYEAYVIQMVQCWNWVAYAY